MVKMSNSIFEINNSLWHILLIGVCIDTYVIYQVFFSEIDELSIVNRKFVIHPYFYVSHHDL